MRKKPTNVKGNHSHMCRPKKRRQKKAVSWYLQLLLFYFSNTALILLTPELEASSFLILKVHIHVVVSTCGHPQSSREYTLPDFPTIE
jgi:hypothetical protein